MQLYSCMSFNTCRSSVTTTRLGMQNKKFLCGHTFPLPLGERAPEQGFCMFYFMRSCQAVFQSGFTILCELFFLSIL